MVFGREPALFLGAISVIVNLAIAFGLQLSAEQVALVNGALAAVVAFAVRQSVSPVDSFGD